MYEFEFAGYSFADLPQLINELGVIDARLAPQYRELLSGGQEDQESKARVPVRKEKVCCFHALCIFHIKNASYRTFLLTEIWRACT